MAATPTAVLISAKMPNKISSSNNNSNNGNNNNSNNSNNNNSNNNNNNKEVTVKLVQEIFPWWVTTLKGVYTSTDEIFNTTSSTRQY